MTDEEFAIDALGARDHATRNPRPKGTVPHWLRCDAIRRADGARCFRPTEHGSKPHAFDGPSGD
jgi:hypothetical protein